MENHNETIFEEPEIVGTKRPTSNSSTNQTENPNLFKKLIGTILVGLTVFVVITGLFVWFIFWILFAILPDVVVYILLGIFAAVMLVNAFVWLSKITVLYGRYKSGRAQFNSVRDQFNNSQ